MIKNDFNDMLNYTSTVWLQPYNYERYKAINPNLTEEVYSELRKMGAEWKILCGLEVNTHWGATLLKEVWFLKNGNGYMETDFYKYRFMPEMYLSLEW